MVEIKEHKNHVICNGLPFGWGFSSNHLHKHSRRTTCSRWQLAICIRNEEEELNKIQSQDATEFMIRFVVSQWCSEGWCLTWADAATQLGRRDSLIIINYEKKQRITDCQYLQRAETISTNSPRTRYSQIGENEPGYRSSRSMANPFMDESISGKWKAKR